MSQLQSPFTQQQYFSNNHQDYDKPHTVSLPEYNIEVKCYSNQLKTGKLAEINRSISEVFKGFFEAFPSAKRAGQKLETINIFIFNDKEDYQHLGGEVFKLGLGSVRRKSLLSGMTDYSYRSLYLSARRKTEFTA